MQRNVIIFLLLLPIVAASLKVVTRINALVPLANEWVAVTDKGLIILKNAPNSTLLDVVAKEVCKTPYVTLLTPVNAPWACTVEALSLLKKPEPLILWNAVPTSNLTCGQRYLFSQVVASSTKGNGTMVIYPLDNTICKRVSVDAFIQNSTLVVNIKISKIKPWLDICPPSKIYDVVVAWGKADRVKIIINGKTVLAERSP